MSPEILTDLTALSPELWLVATIVLTLLADLVWRERGHLPVALFALVGTGFALASLGPAPTTSERTSSSQGHNSQPATAGPRSRIRGTQPPPGRVPRA